MQEWPQAEAYQKQMWHFVELWWIIFPRKVNVVLLFNDVRYDAFRFFLLCLLCYLLRKLCEGLSDLGAILLCKDRFSFITRF